MTGFQPIGDDERHEAVGLERHFGCYEDGPQATQLIRAADDLLAAIEGVTGQFEDEVARLSSAVSALERLIAPADDRAQPDLPNL